MDEKKRDPLIWFRPWRWAECWQCLALAIIAAVGWLSSRELTRLIERNDEYLYDRLVNLCHQLGF